MKGIEQIIEERGIAKGKAEGKAEGKLETATEIAKNLLRPGFVSVETISNSTGLSLEEVKDLQKSILSPLDTPRILAELNALVKYRYQFSDRTKRVWERIPKGFNELMDALKIEKPTQIYL